jgi:iron complex transport system permease protein
MARVESYLHVNQNIRTITLISLLVVVLLVFFMLDLLVGPVSIPVRDLAKMLTGVAGDNAAWQSILFEFRLPKALTAVLAGSALAISGLQMQTVFRNPLAGPDVLGISSGASLGVALVVLGFGDTLFFQGIGLLSSWLQIAAACIGSGIVLFLVMFVSLRIRDIMTILILGILFGSAASAIVSILQYFSHQSMLKAFVVWSMGSLGNLSGTQLKVLAITLGAGFLLSLVTLKKLNVLLLGEIYARSLGVNVKVTRVLIFISTSILAGSITAFCGPLAFIGITIPHLARMIFNTSDHRVLFPASVLLGSSMLLMADLLSHLSGSESVLPVNSVTALLGVPVVVWVIVMNKKLVSIS